MERGEICFADFGGARGSAPAYRHPGIVISADSFNRSQLRTVTMVIISSNPRLAASPGNVRLPVGTAGLDHESVANVTQVATVDRSDLDSPIGRLSASLMSQIDEGLRLALFL